jgi:hypothetical protein
MAAEVTVLVVDDDAEAFERRVRVLPKAIREGVVVRHPEEVTLEDVERASLVLVDYRLEKWMVNSDERVLSRRIPNGISLLAILQQHSMKCTRPTAFAIHSEHLDELTTPFKPEPRVHMLARAFNIDWAFVKSARLSPVQTLARAQILARAVAALPPSWPEEDPVKARQIAWRLLAIPDVQDWTSQAWRDVENAHPPLDEMTLRVHGLLFYRWLLTRVLYYPCFLINRFWLAARLGATPRSVDSALSGELGELLKPASYGGMLEGFAGRRWWRSGVESILWDLGGGAYVDSVDLQSRLTTERRIVLKATAHRDPVVCLDGDYKPLPDLFDPRQTVRLRLDDWPAHADEPRTSIALAAKDQRLAGLVIASDRNLLEV